MTLQLAVRITADASEFRQEAQGAQGATQALGGALDAVGDRARSAAADLAAAASGADRLASAEAAAGGGGRAASSALDLATGAVEGLARAHGAAQAAAAAQASATSGLIAQLMDLARAADLAANAQARLGVRPAGAPASTARAGGAETPPIGAAGPTPVGVVERFAVGGATREVVADQEAMARSAEALRAQLDPLSVATERYGARVAELTTLQRAGLISTDEMTAGTRLAERELAGASRGGGLRSDQWTNLAYQGNDIATSLAMGMSPLMIAAQQGGQVVQILGDTPGGVAGGLKAVAGRVASILTPLRLVAGGFVGLGATVAALGYSWAQSQERIEQGLSGIGAMSRATVADINRIAEAASEGGRLSRGEARDVATAVAATGKVDVSNIGSVTSLAPGYARLFGKSMEEAGGDLARIFADPVKGAEELDKRIGGLDASTQRYIRTLVEQGRRQEAIRVLVRRFAPDLELAAQKTSIWAQAWNKLASAAEGAGRFVARRFVSGTTAEQLREAERELRNAQKNYGIGYGAEEGPEVAEKRAEVRRLQEQLSREEAAPRRLEAAERSRAAEDNVRGILPDLDQLDQMRAKLEQLRATQNDLDALAGMTAEGRRGLTSAMAAATGAVETHMSAQDKARASEALTVRSIEARTTAEKAAIAAERERIALAGQAVSEDDRRRQIEAARAAVFAQSTREAQDRRREAEDRAGMAGMAGYPRQVAELGVRTREALKAAEGNLPAYADTQKAAAAERRAIDVEAIGGPLREANRGLAEQTAALRLQQDAFGASTEAAVRMATAQQLVNRYTADGIPITENLRRIIDSYAEATGRVAARQEDLARRQREVVGGLDDVRSGLRGGVTGLVGDLAAGRNPMDGLASTAERMASGLVDRMISGPLVNGLIGQEGKAGGGLLGDALGGIFGKAAGLSTADITAGIVNLSGPVSGIPGLGATGASGLPSLIGSGMPGLGGAPSSFGASASAEAASGILSRLSGSRADVAEYVRQAALQRGIDPNVALRVINQESAFNPNATNLTARESSYGVMQLNTMGGLGVEALKAGIDVRNPAAWRSQVDYGLDVVKRDGWRQWYGARDVGISRWEGIGRGAPAATMPQVPSVQAPAASIPLSGLDTSLRSIDGAASRAAEGVAGLSGDLSSLPGPLSQTAQGLSQVSSSLGSNGGGGLLSMIAQALGGGAGAAGAGASAGASATLAAADGYVPGYADGRVPDAPASVSATGIVRGPGTPTSDSILARISTGEAIIRASSVNHYGPQLIRALNDRTLPVFAAGGIVGQAPPAARPSIRERQAEAAAASGMAGAGGAPPVNVVINNQAGVEVEQTANRNEAGGVDLLVELRRMVADEVRRPGSDAGRALESTWGLRRTLSRRG